jgi:hypothetical protein
MRHNSEWAANANLGRLLMYVAGLLIVVLVIWSLGKS